MCARADIGPDGIWAVAATAKELCVWLPLSLEDVCDVSVALARAQGRDIGENSLSFGSMTRTAARSRASNREFRSANSRARAFRVR